PALRRILSLDSDCNDDKAVPTPTFVSGPGCSPFKRGDAGSNPAGRTNVTNAFPLRLTAGCRTFNARSVVRIPEGEPNLSLCRFCGLIGRRAARGCGSFCQEMKGLAEGRDNFTVLPSAVR